jgi:helicase-like protein
MVVTDREIKALIAKNRLLTLSRKLTEAEARDLATAIALKRTYQKYRAKHALSFHRSIALAQRFCAQQDNLNGLQPRARNFHINGEMTAGQRKDLLKKFRASPRALMTNARCLQEGIDVPAIDCVVFADPRQSATDIIQAAGRAMRNAEGKKRGCILVPIIVPDNADPETFAETTGFRNVMRVIVALSTQDSRIVDELRAVRYGRRVSNGRIIRPDGKLSIGLRMPFEKFAKAITIKLWERVGRLNRLSFEDAHAWALTSGIKRKEDWEAAAAAGKLPPEVPSSPQFVYRGKGWKSWPHWLGTKRYFRGNDGRPSLEQLTSIVRKLRIKTNKAYGAGFRSGKLPFGAPANPDQIYEEWQGWPVFLGTGRRRAALPIKQSRPIARVLKLKSAKEYYALSRRGKLPAGLPSDPQDYYRDKGWKGWPDWLGNGRRSYRSGWKLPYRKALAVANRLVRKYRLRTAQDWFKCFKSGKVPAGISRNPDIAYANAGWTSYQDWLDSDTRPYRIERSFKQARTIVRKLKVDSWEAYLRTGKRPQDIPAKPWKRYADEWKGMADWLGKNERKS